MATPSESLDCRERVESVEAEEYDGVETERSSRGTASKAREGEMLGDGEPGRCSGDVMVLSGGLVVVSAIIADVHTSTLRRYAGTRCESELPSL